MLNTSQIKDNASVGGNDALESGKVPNFKTAQSTRFMEFSEYIIILQTDSSLKNLAVSVTNVSSVSKCGYLRKNPNCLFALLTVQQAKGT